MLVTLDVGGFPLYRSNLKNADGLQIVDALISGQVIAELTLIDSREHPTTPVRLLNCKVIYYDPISSQDRN